MKKVSALLLFLSCAAKPIIKPPAESKVTVGDKTGIYRPWDRAIDLCAIDKKLFEADLQSMNVLLADFLGKTTNAPDALWSAEQIALLEQAQKVLPMPLDIETNAIAKVRKAGCKFDQLQPAEEMISQSQKRLKEAPDLLAGAKAKLELQQWKVGIISLMEQGKTKCPEKPKSNAPPMVYFASADENAKAEWFFCDGQKVVASPGNPPALELPAIDPSVKKQPKVKKPQPYLDAATAYPSDRVSHAPKAVKNASGAGASASEEPKDGAALK
jgi:hypothetical protein